LSQRLSRLVRSAASFAGRALRAIFPDVAFTVEGNKFSIVQANPRPHSARIYSLRVATRRFLNARQTMTISPTLPNKKAAQYAMRAIFSHG